MRKVVRLGPRLAMAAEMAGSAETIWDIGCDHGYLAAALAAGGAAEHIVASDISPASVIKTERLIERLGLKNTVRVINADGLNGFEPQGEYKLVFCGMGGELIAEMLQNSADIAHAAKLIVMQPMRGEEELRSFLCQNGYGITAEKAVCDDGRYYQLIAAAYGPGIPRPEWFPEGHYRFGWVMCLEPDENVIGLIKGFREGHAKRLHKAVSFGRTPPMLVKELAEVDTILTYLAAHGSVRAGEAGGEQHA